MASKGKLVVGGCAALAAVVLLAVWLVPFHHGAEYCGSVLHPAAGLSDDDPCTVAINDRGSVLGLTFLVLFIAAPGAAAGIALGTFIRGIRRRKRVQ